MERRSKRGRTSSISETPTTPSVAAVVEIATPSVDVPVPEIGSEEVVLNRRGMPARQRKRNRFYYDEEIMVTGDSLKKGNKSPGKRIKSEPVDEEVEETITSDIPDYEHFGGEVEISAEPDPEEEEEEEEEEEVVVPVKGGRGSKKSLDRVPERGRGRPPKKSEGTPAKGRGSEKGTPKHKSHSLETPQKSRGRESKGKDHSSKSPRHESSRASPGKSFERSMPTPSKGARGSNKDESRSKSVESSPSPMKTSTKAKKEPGIVLDAAALQEQRYLEKREKDRLAKERERERKREKEREREYNSVMPIKSRARREPSPSNDFTSGLLPPMLSGHDELKQAIDKKTAQDISLRLRNLLKLPKAHKWVCYEWFYSNIDKVLFEGENDFQICLKESFPQLKARKLTRVEWCKIRRLMGKPRRCSQSFFDEEREELGRRRQKIRMIQQRKITDFNYKELPDEIPLQLTIGTKVTARLRRPQDGLFTGTIEGVDTSNNTYRITFDRAGLGTHSIPDYEVLSNDPVETVSTSSFALKIPRRSFGFGTAAFKFQNPGLVGEDGLYRFPTSPFPEGGMLGGFPIRLLDMIVRLSKLLKAKREKILQLKELNVEAEKMRSYGKQLNTDYRLRYARCVLDLDSMNKEMAMYVEGIQTYCLEQIAPDHGANQMIVPEQVQEQCKQEATLIVDTYNTKQNRLSVHGSKALNLVGNLTSLMLQVKTLSSGERNLYELKSIKDTIKETKAALEGKNLQMFQNRVEIPMNRIQAGLCIYTKPY